MPCPRHIQAPLLNDCAPLTLIKTFQVPDFIGVEATPCMLQFLWDSNVAAVAGDAPSFERSPVGGGKSDAYRAEEVTLEGVGSLHEVLLGGWGCPIGEMFDLERLREMCQLTGRWTFFVSSVPLKVSGIFFFCVCSLFFSGVEGGFVGGRGLTSQQVLGGVASPPNSVAIF